MLYVNSYHKGYQWSDGEEESAVKVFKDNNLEYQVIYMDTKNNPEEDFKVKAGKKVKDYIEKYKPDVLIVADDNAFKYVVMPYYRDAELPVVFCGINWDISEYQAPYSNTTGMLEVGLIDGVYKHMKKFVRGDVVGFIGPDVYSEHRNAEYYAKFVDGGFDYVEFAPDFETWKEKYLGLKDKVDMFISPGPSGIKNWDIDKANEFMLRNVNVPIGTESTDMMGFSLVGLSKVPGEHGEYAAKTALRILIGEKPSNIPIVSNKKGYLMLNLAVADRLHIVYTPAMLRNAEIIYGITK
ncbi:MAG: ABC transporter substrate-binding protein [Candidatus Omnitrophica bacterium]|nr:ABC transporter substrate-binding protein [Candidatus Omnitrophota bacterium]